MKNYSFYNNETKRYELTKEGSAASMYQIARRVGQYEELGDVSSIKESIKSLDDIKTKTIPDILKNSSAAIDSLKRINAKYTEQEALLKDSLCAIVYLLAEKLHPGEELTRDIVYECFGYIDSVQQDGKLKDIQDFVFSDEMKEDSAHE